MVYFMDGRGNADYNNPDLGSCINRYCIFNFSCFLVFRSEVLSSDTKDALV